MTILEDIEERNAPGRLTCTLMNCPNARAMLSEITLRRGA